MLPLDGKPIQRKVIMGNDFDCCSRPAEMPAKQRIVFILANEYIAGRMSDVTLIDMLDCVRELTD